LNETALRLVNAPVWLAAAALTVALNRSLFFAPRSKTLPVA
jgi:hypothetical protein